MTKIIHFMTLIIPLIVSYGCASFATHKPYICEDQTVIHIDWSHDTAIVSIDKTIHILQSVRAASGARYSNEHHEIWEHQGILRWTDQDGKSRLCQPAS
jgi:membrane-bound inhibitor of C-type lysozyme